MIEQNAQQLEQEKPKQGPGDRLQSARISKGLTLDDVARKMHLSTYILQSLEENNFEEITAPIFVKGYLRAYARIVNVNEDDIIQQYSSCYMDSDPPILSTSNTSPEINANDTRVKWMTSIIILGLIALLSTWWWNRYQQSPETLSLDAGKQLHITADLAEPGPASTMLDKTLDKMDTTAVESADKLLVEPAEADTKEIEASVEMVTPAQSTQTGSLAAKQQAVDGVSAEQPVDAGIAPDEMAAEAPQASADDALIITVTADTWASIKDADGNKLVYDLLRSGEQLSVTGKAPISAFLGNGYGVSMTYQGKEVDLSHVIRSDNTARLKIGK